MLIDGRDIANDSVLEADLCVIGAGPAGITIARELANTSRSVVLLESGGFDTDEKTQDLAKGQIIGLPLNPEQPLTLRDIRLRYFGGSSNHWAGACRPLSPWDFEQRQWIPRSGWPVTAAEMSSWYERAATVLKLPANPFSVERYAAQIAAEGEFPDEKDFTVALTRHAQVRFGTVYRDDVVKAENVRVCLWTNATKLVAKPSGQEVESVECATLRGNKFRVRARAFVVATGGIEVPRLLLASNDVRPRGLGNDSGFVGRCFMEHLIGLGGWAVLTVPRQRVRLFTLQPPPADPSAPVTPYKPKVSGDVIPTAELMEREELQDLAVGLTFIVPRARLNRRSRGVGPHAVAELSVRVDRAGSAGIASPLYVVGEQRPNPASRVQLLRSKDALGMPKVSLDWRLTPADYERMFQGLLMMAERLGQAGLGRFQLQLNDFVIRGANPAGDLPDRFPMNTGFHHMGTARMSTDPRQGVTDANAKLHTVSNVFVAGSALWTTSGVAPPTFSIVAFALRLASHLTTQVLT